MFVIYIYITTNMLFLWISWSKSGEVSWQIQEITSVVKQQIAHEVWHHILSQHPGIIEMAWTFRGLFIETLLQVRRWSLEMWMQRWRRCARDRGPKAWFPQHESCIFFPFLEFILSEIFFVTLSCSSSCPTPCSSYYLHHSSEFPTTAPTSLHFRASMIDTDGRQVEEVFLALHELKRSRFNKQP